MALFPVRKRGLKNFLYLILLSVLLRCSDKNQNLSTSNGNDTNEIQSKTVSAGTIPSQQNLEEERSTKKGKVLLTSVQSIRCGTPVINKAKAPPIAPLSSEGCKGYLPMQNFNTEQGLGLSSVSSCYADREGFIWFSTYGGGVSRFDGKSFTSFSKIHGLSNNTIYCIEEDLNGNIWFGTEGQGADCYDGKRFRNYSTRQGLTNNTVRSITRDRKGRLWFGTDNGATMYDGTEFHNVTPAGLLHASIRTIYEDQSGAMWFGTEGHGLCRYDGKTHAYYNTLDGLSDNTVWSFCEDNTHKLWVGTSNGISCFEGNLITNYILDGTVSNIPIKTISKDQTGRLWFATFGKGVLYYDGKFFTNLTKLNSGLGDNKVTALTIDQGNHIWFGTFGSGVSSFDGGALSYYTNVNGLSGNHIRCILQDSKGNLWFGADRDGLSRFDGNTFFNYFARDGLPNNNIWCSHEDKKGNLWFGTYGGGLCKYDGNWFNNYTVKQGLASNKILCIVEDQKDRLWFGTDTGGVICFDGNVFKTYKTINGLASNNVWCGIEDNKGRLWFGTFGGGLSCFDGHSFTNYSTADGLSDNTILCIAEDKAGNIWFGTDGGGVNRYDGKSFTAYGSAQGLNNNEVYAISVNEKGEIILGTNLGISILSSFVRNGKSGNEINFSGQTHREDDILNSTPTSNTLANEELQGNFSPLFEEYYQKTGYEIRDVNTNAILCDSKGVIWAGCGDGKLVKLDTRISRKRKRLPLSYIQGLRLQNEVISWSTVQAENSKLLLSDEGERGKSTSADNRQPAIAPEALEEAVLFEQPLNEQQRVSMARKYSRLAFNITPGFSFVPRNLVLPCEFNQVTFDYSAIVPSDFPTTHFQYMLKGYDKDWSPVTEKTSATFGNIYEGKYNFILRARNRFGEWGPPIIYSFEVLPPLYRTWWAYTLYILLALLSIWLYTRWREKQLKKEKSMLKEKIAKQKQIDSERNELMKDIVRRNKDLEQFSYIVSHNLRAPVANILGAAGLLQDSNIKKTDEKFLMTGLINSVNKLDGVLKDLNDMLELRNNANEKKELVRFSELLADIKASIGGNAQISGDFSAIDEFFTLKSYMYSIFLNLISNSIKYRRPDAEPIIKISSIKRGKGIILVFNDNGLGIDLEKAGKRIFGLYQRFHEQKEGKGVGLYMVKTEVEALGGQISVTSELNVGTTFTLVFEEN